MSDHWQGKGGSKGEFPGAVKADTAASPRHQSSNPAGGKMNTPSGNTSNK